MSRNKKLEEKLGSDSSPPTRGEVFSRNYYKKDFLKKLERSLSGIAEAEKKEILFDYEEHFRNGLAESKTEEEIVRALGNPAAIGKAYKADTILSKARDNKSVGNILKAVFAAMSLGFVNLVFVLGPFLGPAGALIGLWAAAGSIALSGVGILLGLVFSPFVRSYVTGPSKLLFTIFSSIGLSALGALFCIGMTYVSKWFYKITLKYIGCNFFWLTEIKRHFHLLRSYSGLNRDYPSSP